MEVKRKFLYQCNGYGCGAYSVYHLSILMDIDISLAEAEDICLTISYLKGLKKINLKKLVKHPVRAFRDYSISIGTEVKGIKRGVRKLGLKYKEFVYYDKNKFIKYLDKGLSKGPVILLVNYSQIQGDLGHWVLCSKKIDDYYIIIDSSPYSGSVKQKYSECKLLKRMVWYDDGEEYYEMIGVAIKKDRKS